VDSADCAILPRVAIAANESTVDGRPNANPCSAPPAISEWYWERQGQGPAIRCCNGNLHRRGPLCNQSRGVDKQICDTAFAYFLRLEVVRCSSLIRYAWAMRRSRKRPLCASGQFVLFRRRLRDRKTYDPSECPHPTLRVQLQSHSDTLVHDLGPQTTLAREIDGQPTGLMSQSPLSPG